MGERSQRRPQKEATFVTVLMRCCNDMPLIEQTLEMVARQTVPVRLVVFDNDSTDGSLEVIGRFTDEIHRVVRGEYVPGVVLNRAMEASTGDIAVFLNSDCTPVNDQWLAELIRPFNDPKVAAVFGQQHARPGCLPLYALEVDRAFGDGQEHKQWTHFFSMASSAVRRSVWSEMRFDESLTYSEDIDFTWRVRQRGFEIAYAERSGVYHSHNYTLKQAFSRHRGEGLAEARSCDWSQWQGSLIRYSALPYLRNVAADWRSLLPRGEFRGAAMSPVLRLAQALGRRRGFVSARRGRS